MISFLSFTPCFMYSFCKFQITTAHTRGIMNKAMEEGKSLPQGLWDRLFPARFGSRPSWTMDIVSRPV